MAAALSACGSSAPADSSTPTAGSATIPAGIESVASGNARLASAQLRDWPEFGLNPRRSDASLLSSAVTAANVAHLRRVTVALAGTVDSSPIYLHEASVAGAKHDVAIVTTTYGKTLALDATSGHILWTFTPPGYSRWAGSAQITTAGPLSLPGEGFVYATSPNGLVHKLSLASGREAAGWPVAVTKDAAHEKLAAALNVAGPYLVVATGGYLGDAPPYQGHVVAIDRASGRIASVFDTLCASRRRVIVPSSCGASDSAILSRGGAVVEPGGKRLLISTGNGPWNGSTNLGDSVIELSVPGLDYRQAFTPTNQERLNTSDTDLGSSAPVLLGHDRVLIAGKDGVMRVLSLSHLDGGAPSRPNRLGGEVQRLPLPGGGELFSAPAVVAYPAARAGATRRPGATVVFVGAEHATAAYTLTAGRLRLAWQNSTPGTSPIVVGGLLYVYDPADGGIYVYRPHSGVPIAKLPGAPGHWNSPIVVNGHVIEPEGDANEHKLTGALELFSVR